MTTPFTLDDYAAVVLRPMMVDLFKREFLNGAEGVSDEQVEAALEQWLVTELGEA